MSDLRKVIRSAAAFLTGLCMVQPIAAAQSDPARDYPSKPIRLIVGVVAGGASDVTARAVAQKLSEAWGRQVVVDNRTGAMGAIALDLTAKAVPDGYTICTVSASQVIDSVVNPRLPYVLANDFAAISQTSTLFYVVYHTPSVPVKSIKDLIAYAKANPGKLNYGSAGTGGLQHFAWEMLSHSTGIKLVHVPYKGGPAVLAAAVAGDVQIGMTAMLNVRPHMSSGRLRFLAITAKNRSPAMPELPTVAEAGVPGYEVDQWYGLITGSKVSPAIVRKLSAGIAEALKAPDVVQRLGADGSTAVSSSPEAFSAHIRSEGAKWGKLVKDARLALN